MLRILRSTSSKPNSSTSSRAEGAAGGREVDRLGALHLGEVAHAAQQAVGDARRPPAAAGDLGGARRIDRHAEQPGRAQDDLGQLLRAVEVEAVDDAEARPQRRADQPRPRRRPHQGEPRQVDLHRPRRRPLADHEVEAEVLQGRVEDLLDRRPQAVDLVDEQHLPRIEVGEDGGEVAGALEDGSGGGAQGRSHLAGDDVGEGRLAEAGGAEEEDVVERLAALAGGADEHPQVVDDLLLPDVLLEPLRAQRRLDPEVLGVRDAGEEVVFDGGHGFILAARRGRAG